MIFQLQKVAVWHRTAETVNIRDLKDSDASDVIAFNGPMY